MLISWYHFCSGSSPDQATTEISMKNAQDLESLRRELIEKYEHQIESMKEILQKDFEANALRQAAEIEELEMRHADELKMARRQLEDDQRRSIRRELEEEFSRIAVEQAEQMQEREMRHAEELRLLRERYELGGGNSVHREVDNDIASNAINLARQMEELEMKHADEMKRLRQKYEREEVDVIRREMREGFDREPALQSDQIQDIELRHEKDLTHLKERYEALLAEKTHELRNEVNVLRSLLEDSKKEIHRLSDNFVDAVPSAPPLNDLPGSRSMDSLAIPRHMLGEGATPTSSTETLIERFRDGDVVKAFNEACKDVSSDDGSHMGTSFSGSVPSLLYPGGAPYPVARPEAGRDEVEQNQEAVLEEMRRRFRPSDSDSGRSYDQMMEPGLEEEESSAKLLREKVDELQAKLAKQKEELEGHYHARIHDLEQYIHRLATEHAREVHGLREQGLQQVEKEVNEVKEEAAIEKVHLQKEAYLQLQTSKMELNDKNEKLLKKFIKEQDKATEELKNGK